MSPMLMKRGGKKQGRVVEGKVRWAVGAQSCREWKNTGEF